MMSEIGIHSNPRYPFYRICVHAIPASDAEEYQGMPMFAEVGPLVMDEKVVSVSLNQREFKVNLEKVKEPMVLLQSVRIPHKCQLAMTNSEVSLISQTLSEQPLLVKFSFKECQFLVVKHVNNKVELQSDDGKYIGFLTFMNNFERDVFMIAFRNTKLSFLESLQEV